MNIGSEIRAARKAAGLKQVELSKKAGISNSYLSGIECGKILPGEEAFDKICNALGTRGSILVFKAIKESDVKPEKLDAYLRLKPIIDVFLKTV